MTTPLLPPTIPAVPAPTGDNIHGQINRLQAAGLLVLTYLVTNGVPWLAAHVADLAQFGQPGLIIGGIATFLVANHIFDLGKPPLVPATPATPKP